MRASRLFDRARAHAIAPDRVRLMEALDPGWAATIGAGIGALATALGSVVAPIVRDIITRRAIRTENVRDKRHRLALQILEGLDTVTGTPRDKLRENVRFLTNLTNEASLVDKNGDIANIVSFAAFFLSSEDSVSRSLIAMYVQGVVTSWGRFDSNPTINEFMDEVLRLRDMAEPVDNHRVESDE